MIRQSSNAEVVPHPPIVMEEVTDPEKLARSKAQREQFDRNVTWSQTIPVEYWDQHRGKHICIAGQEVFIDDTIETAMHRAREAHPDDDGIYFFYLPLKKIPRIYAHPWPVASLQ